MLTVSPYRSDTDVVCGDATKFLVNNISVTSTPLCYTSCFTLTVCHLLKYSALLPLSCRSDHSQLCSPAVSHSHVTLNSVVVLNPHWTVCFCCPSGIIQVLFPGFVLFFTFMFVFLV